MEQADSKTDMPSNDSGFSSSESFKFSQPCGGGLFAKRNTCAGGFASTFSSETIKPASTGGFSFGSNTTNGHSTFGLPSSMIPSAFTRPPLPLDYKIYDNRFKTFAKWPNSDKVNPQSLATAGFKYTGLGDRCECVFCHLLLTQFEYFDNPMTEHRKYNPTCPYLLMILPS